MKKVFGILLLLCLMASPALAEEQRTRYRAAVVQLDAAAYQVHCEVEYTNPAETPLTGVVFTMYANQLRRESSLAVQTEQLEAAFPAGYAPGGVEFAQITVDGAPADWGMQGEDELFVRVGCDLAPGETAVFGFDYQLLVLDSRSTLGFSEKDIRLTGFLPGVAVWDEDEFVVNNASSIDRYAYHEPADYTVDLTVGDEYVIAAPGTLTQGESAQGYRAWRIEAQGVREFALSMSEKFRERTVASALGTDIRLLGWDQSGLKRAAGTAQAAIDLLETWLGKAPFGQITIAMADLATDGAGFGGLVWIPEAQYGGRQKAALEHDVVYYLAQQYFGMAAGNDPVQAPWLSVSVPEMLYYQYIEAREGHDSMLGQINEDCLSALVMTLPGGYTVLDPLTAFFEADIYENVVRHRGAAAFYLIREDMGTDMFLAGLREFYRQFNGRFAGLQDFVSAFNAVSDRTYDILIVDWLHTINDYQGHAIDFFQ